MGMVLGKIDVETPDHRVIARGSDYEIREYPSSVIAEFTYDPSEFGGSKDGGFRVLANYIGALGKPENTCPEKIAMTAPVITQSEKIAMTAPVITQSEKIAMTAPVITQSEPEAISMTAPVITSESSGERKVTMQFILPSKYKKATEAPIPTNKRVLIKEENEKKYGVVKFSGVASDKVVEEKVMNLKESLHRDGYKITGQHLLARYNPPFTLPFLRTNEIMIPVE